MYLKAAGDTEKALVAYTDSLLILTGMKKQKHQLVHTLLGLADLLNSIGKYEAALDHYKDCLSIQKSLLSETHEDIATTLYLMGVVKMNHCQYDASLAYLKESVEVKTSSKDGINSFNGDAYNLMGFVEMRNGNRDGALSKFSDALRIRRALGKRLKEAETLKNIGNVYRENKEHERALEQYREALVIITEEEGRDSERVVDVLVAMGSIMSDLNSHDHALSHYKNGMY